MRAHLIPLYVLHRYILKQELSSLSSDKLFRVLSRVEFYIHRVVLCVSIHFSCVCFFLRLPYILHAFIIPLLSVVLYVSQNASCSFPPTGVVSLLSSSSDTGYICTHTIRTPHWSPIHIYHCVALTDFFAISETIRPLLVLLLLPIARYVWYREICIDWNFRRAGAKERVKERQADQRGVHRLPSVECFRCWCCLFYWYIILPRIGDWLLLSSIWTTREAASFAVCIALW